MMTGVQGNFPVFRGIPEIPGKFFPASIPLREGIP